MVKKTSTKNKDKQKNEIEELKIKSAENLAGWKRALADYKNFKKRQSENEKELIKYSNENLILEILPVLDNFRHAYKGLPKEMEGNAWAEGIKYIKAQFEDVLRNSGVEEIKSVGEEFDPEIHEAVEEIKSKDKKFKKGVIVEEVIKGYRLNGKVIRAAKVKVAA
jgi:molecular chaperone GrpE